MGYSTDKGIDKSPHCPPPCVITVSSHRRVTSLPRIHFEHQADAGNDNGDVDNEMMTTTMLIMMIVVVVVVVRPPPPPSPAYRQGDYFNGNNENSKTTPIISILQVIRVTELMVTISITMLIIMLMTIIMGIYDAPNLSRKNANDNNNGYL